MNFYLIDDGVYFVPPTAAVIRVVVDLLWANTPWLSDDELEARPDLKDLAVLQDPPVEPLLDTYLDRYIEQLRKEDPLPLDAIAFHESVRDLASLERFLRERGFGDDVYVSAPYETNSATFISVKPEPLKHEGQGNYGSDLVIPLPHSRGTILASFEND